MSRSLLGVVGTPVTPFTDEKEVDYATLAQLVDFEVRHGAQMMALPMHIGESLNLSIAERMKVAETAIKAVDGRIPVFVHASLPATDQVIEIAQHAELAGATGVVVITPYHWRPSPEALLQHYRAVAAAVSIDLIAYNFPARLGVAVTGDLLARLLSDIPTFVGMKDASYDMQWFTEACRIARDLRPEFALYTGVDYLLPSMPVGGTGCFSPCHAIAPTLINSLYQACRDGDYARARDLQFRASQLWHLLKVGYPGSVKAAMELQGRPVGGVRLPLLEPSAEVVAGIRDGLSALGILSEEPKGWDAMAA